MEDLKDLIRQFLIYCENGNLIEEKYTCPCGEPMTRQVHKKIEPTFEIFIKWVAITPTQS